MCSPSLLEYNPGFFIWFETHAVDNTQPEVSQDHHISCTAHVIVKHLKMKVHTYMDISTGMHCLGPRLKLD